MGFHFGPFQLLHKKLLNSNSLLCSVVQILFNMWEICEQKKKTLKFLGGSEIFIFWPTENKNKGLYITSNFICRSDSGQIFKVKLVTVVEGNPKAPFSIGVGEGATPFPGLLPFILDPYLIMLSVKQGAIKYHF